MRAHGRVTCLVLREPRAPELFQALWAVRLAQERCRVTQGGIAQALRPEYGLAWVEIHARALASGLIWVPVSSETAPAEVRRLFPDKSAAIDPASVAVTVPVAAAIVLAVVIDPASVVGIVPGAVSAVAIGQA
jgi:hypothetical protein